LALQENRIIITFDSDFGELIFKKGFQPKGVIYFRWKSFKPKAPGEYLAELFQNETITFDGYLTVIDENQIRQRVI